MEFDLLVGLLLTAYLSYFQEKSFSANYFDYWIPFKENLIPGDR